jgi:hypothetical protein
MFERHRAFFDILSQDEFGRSPVYAALNSGSNSDYQAMEPRNQLESANSDIQ